MLRANNKLYCEREERLVMETREELLNGLNDAVSIIRKLGNIQQRLTGVRNQYKSHLPSSKRMKRGGIFFIIAMVVVGEVLVESIGIPTIGAILGGVGGYFAKKAYYKAQNEKIDDENEEVKKQEQVVLNDLQQVQAEYRERVGTWYPESYCSVDAVEFFYNAIKNYRADNMKEAINLYETTLHQRRVEDNQQQAIKQQKLNNLLTVGSIAMQAANVNAIENQTQSTLGALRNQTSAVNRNADELKKINDKLSTPKWLR